MSLTETTLAALDKERKQKEHLEEVVARHVAEEKVAEEERENACELARVKGKSNIELDCMPLT